MQKSFEIRTAATLPGLLLALVSVPSCSDKPAADAEIEPEATPAASSFLPAPPTAATGCGETGELRTTLYGALAGDLHWAAGDMSCEGMPRPENRGARLRFAGTAGEDEYSLAFIIALPDLERATIANEIPSNVTIIEEGKGRFFSTADLDSCWTDVSIHSALEEVSNRFAIAGRLYCIAPLAEVNGDSSVTVPELHFAGQLDWAAE